MSRLFRYYQNPGIVSFIVMSASFLAVLSLLALLLVSLTGWSFSRATNVSYTSISSIFMLGGIGWTVVSRFRAGPVLLDIKAMFPGRGWLVAGAIGYLFLLSLDFDFGNVQSDLESKLVFLLLPVYFITLILGRLQVRRRGIWLYTALIPWHKIESYSLQDGRAYFRVNNAKFWASNPDAWLRKGYTVPEAHIEAFEACLLEHNIPNINHTESIATA